MVLMLADMLPKDDTIEQGEVAGHARYHAFTSSAASDVRLAKRLLLFIDGQ